MRKELLDEIEKMKVALKEAIADAQSAEETSYAGFNGQMLSKSAGSHTYQFTLRTYWDIDDNAKIAIVDTPIEQERQLKIDARVLSREASTLMIVTRTPLLAESLAHAFFIEDKTWLLKRELQALSSLTETSAEFGAKTLALTPVRSETKTVRGKMGNFTLDPHQEKAIAHGLGSEKTLVIGPPGTGKTTVLSDLICRYLRQNLSVLLVSHTNIATDNAFMHLIQAIQNSKKADLQTLMDQGLVVRAGDPHLQGLRTGNYRRFTVNGQAEAHIGKQIEAREKLEKALPKLLQRIEDLERKARKREEARQKRWEELNEAMEPLELELATLLAQQQERERKDQEFLVTKAKEHKEANAILTTLQKQQRELVENRKVGVDEADRRAQAWGQAVREDAKIRTMGKGRHLFPAHNKYDFEATKQEIARLLVRKEQADTEIVNIDKKLQENQLEQMEPSLTVYQIDQAVQGFYNVKALGDHPDVAHMKRLEKKIALLEEELRQGDQQLSEAHEQIVSLGEERDRIKARIEELKAQQAGFKAQIIADAQLVTTTITGVYLNLNLSEREFDVVVVDELSMISVIGVLLVAARAMKHFVGAGDPNQLSPVVKLENANNAPRAKEWLGKDLFRYLGINIFDAIHGDKECVLLTQQGRAHPTIISPINHYIYQDILTSREETLGAPGIEPHTEWPLFLVDTTGTEARCIKPSKTQPRENEYHARVAVALARPVLESLPPRSPSDDPAVPRIVIIAPYRSQVQLVMRMLRKAKIAHLVHVGTINTVQSLEFPVVIFDTVEAPGTRPWEFSYDRIFDDEQMATEATRKVNVAWTRARYKLIVIAHRKHLHDHLPHHMEKDPVRKQRLLVDLVDWTYEQGHISAIDILGPVAKKEESP